MNNEKWEELVEMVEGKFDVVEGFTEDTDFGTQDVLVFEAPHGTFKLVRENRPMVLEKKMHYSHRAGDTAQTEYKFSDTDFTHRLRVFKEVNGEFEEVTLEHLRFT